jgi:uncharacterized cupin superfamily protein
VGLATVNIRLVELDHRLDEAGFRHAATAVGDRLGARRIGAGVYRAEAGAPIWPYHYHHGIEEWLYVLAGAPVLRDPAATRTLAPGDLVRFPSGHRGAHTVSGPGHFAIFATGQHDEPWLSVYPDSDKVSGPVAPGESAWPYRYVWGREEWLLVVAGTPTLRDRDGRQELGEGDVVCIAEGPAGAHQLRNDGGAVARVLSLSTTGSPVNVCCPETGRWVLRHAPGEDDLELQA